MACISGLTDWDWIIGSGTRYGDEFSNAERSVVLLAPVKDISISPISPECKCKGELILFKKRKLVIKDGSLYLQLLAYFLLSRCSVCLESSSRYLILMIIMIKYLARSLSFISSGGCLSGSLGPIRTTNLFIIPGSKLSQLLYDRCGCSEVVCTRHHGLITFW